MLGNARSATQAFADWAKGIVQKLWAEIRAKFQEPKFIVGELKGLINAFVRLFAKEVAPFVKGMMDMVKGLAKAAPLIITKIKTWMHGRHVTLIRGHPAITIRSMKNALSLGIMEGLYIAIKGAVDIALTTVTAGAAALAKVVIAFVEAAVKIIWRMFELSRFEEFCAWCKRAFAKREAPSAPHKNTVMFTKTYKKYAMSVPTIAALVLMSGICGDKMRFLQLYYDDGSVISQTDFDHGVAMIDGLKPFANLMLRNMGFNFVIKDPLVKKLVDKAKEDAKPITTRGKIAHWVNNVLTL